MVIDKDIGTSQHLSVKFSPSSLAPTCISNSEMQTILVQIVPESACRDVPQWISIIMSHHLRFTCCSTSEVHQHDIIVGIRMCRLHKRSCMGNTFLEVLESLRHTRTDADYMLQSRTPRLRFDDMIGYDLFTRTNNHFDIGCITTIDDVLLSQQMSRRNSYCTQLVQSDDAEPKLDTAFQNKHHHIALTDTQALEIGSRSIGLFLQFRICILMFGSLVVSPKNRILFRLFGSPSIHYIITKIKVFRDLYLKILYKFLLRGVFRLFYKSL